jgi:hypothetical protein
MRSWSGANPDRPLPLGQTEQLSSETLMSVFVHVSEAIADGSAKAVLTTGTRWIQVKLRALATVGEVRAHHYLSTAPTGVDNSGAAPKIRR